MLSKTLNRFSPNEFSQFTNIKFKDRSLLIIQFGDEFQTGSLQILGDPFVDFTVHFRAEMVLPASRLTFSKTHQNYSF
jgi:hypothetical protein